MTHRYKAYGLWTFKVLPSFRILYGLKFSKRYGVIGKQQIRRGNGAVWIICGLSLKL